MLSSNNLSVASISASISKSLILATAILSAAMAPLMFTVAASIVTSLSICTLLYTAASAALFISRETALTLPTETPRSPPLMTRVPAKSNSVFSANNTPLASKVVVAVVLAFNKPLSAIIEPVLLSNNNLLPAIRSELI